MPSGLQREQPALLRERGQEPERRVQQREPVQARAPLPSWSKQSERQQ